MLKQRLFVFAVAAAACGAAATRLAATTVTYTASGTFATTAISGMDQLKLAGQPFTLVVTAMTGTKPTQHGPNNTWAAFNNLPVTGTVYSGLLPGVPIPIPPGTLATLFQTGGYNKPYQYLAFGFPIVVLNYNITVTARVAMPPNTIPNPLINPFSAPVNLTSPPDILTYADSTNSTTLGLASGTISTATSAARTTASVLPYRVPQFAAPVTAMAARRELSDYFAGLLA